MNRLMVPYAKFKENTVLTCSLKLLLGSNPISTLGFRLDVKCSGSPMFQIIQIYEWKGIPLIKYKPFFWGKEGITYYSSLKKKLQTLDEKPDANKVLGEL